MINSTVIDDSFVPPSYSRHFIFGKCLATLSIILIFVAVFIGVKFEYKRRYKWRIQSPSKLLLPYSYSVDSIVWVSMIYWLYETTKLVNYYDEYCSLVAVESTTPYCVNSESCIGEMGMLLLVLTIASLTANFALHCIVLLSRDELQTDIGRLLVTRRVNIIGIIILIMMYPNEMNKFYEIYYENNNLFSKNKKMGVLYISYTVFGSIDSGVH